MKSSLKKSSISEFRVQNRINCPFKDKTRCKTPHLTEDEIKSAFVRMVNKLYADRELTITELTAIKDRLGDTTVLEKERRILDEQLGIDAKAVNDLIARNARVAQDQKEYNERYDALVSRYEETEKKRDAVMEKIDQIMIRRRKIERFIDSVKGIPELITEFDESLWAGLGDNGTPWRTQRSGSAWERRSDGVSELSRLRGSELIRNPRRRDDGAQQGPDRLEANLRDGD